MKRASGESLPLRGTSILVTRAAEAAAELAERLRELGARVETRATIRLVEPADPRPARAAAASAAARGFAWVAFTSGAGVRFFVEALAAGGRSPSAVSARVAAVGAETARAARSAGLAVALVPPAAESDALAAALAPFVGGMRVLLVRPEGGDPELAQALQRAGAEVEAIAFYRNAPAPAVGAVAADVVAGAYQVVLFSSPSSLRRLLELREPGAAAVREALGRCRLVALGPTTAAALRAAGFEAVHTAAGPSAAQLVRAVLRSCASSRGSV